MNPVPFLFHTTLQNGTESCMPAFDVDGHHDKSSHMHQRFFGNQFLKNNPDGRLPPF